ncbi:hypothetical protein DUNSADRAFT_4086 [Dunaliella salina]|uniref:Uncharacterized protein n=1 Tax=Dunaliella salina TaxID=3046 RepID=A0ABQ7GSR7_DUNSA|nr:hypothetical protein DUNSADRAFT_4086 [Dunaliella salina]|eukprot:KAF5837653.1 hypothetical protein DUNSADRAFT_4086 [Dunaliella salina]
MRPQLPSLSFKCALCLYGQWFCTHTHTLAPDYQWYADGSARSKKQRRREGQHASKQAKLAVNYMEGVTGEDGSYQHAALIRATQHGFQLTLAGASAELIQMNDSTWIRDMEPLVERFHKATQVKPLPAAQRQRHSAFAHAPPAQRQGNSQLLPNPAFEPPAASARTVPTQAQTAGAGPSQPGARAN